MWHLERVILISHRSSSSTPPTRQRRTRFDSAPSGLRPQASFSGHLDRALFPVEHGADPEAQDQGGLTPLYQAFDRGHLGLAQFLVKHVANAAVQNKGGSTPLHLASQWVVSMSHGSSSRPHRSHRARCHHSSPEYTADPAAHDDMN